LSRSSIASCGSAITIIVAYLVAAVDRQRVVAVFRDNPRAHHGQFPASGGGDAAGRRLHASQDLLIS